jgi:hypothetical protein
MGFILFCAKRISIVYFSVGSKAGIRRVIRNVRLPLDSGHQTDAACVSLVSAKCQKENSSLSLDPNGHYNFELKGRLRHATRNALRQKRRC